MLFHSLPETVGHLFTDGLQFPVPFLPLVLCQALLFMLRHHVQSLPSYTTIF